MRILVFFLLASSILISSETGMAAVFGQESEPSPKLILKIAAGPNENVQFLSISANSRFVAYLQSSDGRHQAYIHDLKLDERVAWKPGKVAFSPRGSIIAAYQNDHLALFDFDSKKELHRLQFKGTLTLPPAFSQDGKYLFGIGGYLVPEERLRSQPLITAWEVTTGRKVAEIDCGKHGPIIDFALSNDGQYVVAEHRLHTEEARNELVEGKGLRKYLIKVTHSMRVWERASGRDLGLIGKPVEISWDNFGRVSGNGEEETNSQKPQLIPRFGTSFVRVRVSPGKSVAVFPWLPSMAVLHLNPARADLAVIHLATGKVVLDPWYLRNQRPELIRLSKDESMVVISGSSGPLKGLYAYDITSLRRKPSTSTDHLTESAAQSMWEKLSTFGPASAFESMRRLAAAPNAIPLLKQQLKPASHEKLSVLITQTDSTNFTVRDKAQGSLLLLGEESLEAIRDAIKRPRGLESQRRLFRIIEELKSQPDAHTCRQLWGIEVLEQVGNREAQDVLADIARGRPTSWITLEAKAALNRAKQQ